MSFETLLLIVSIIVGIGCYFNFRATKPIMDEIHDMSKED